MTINFQTIPTSTIRIPGVFFEINASLANTAQQVQRALIVGQAGAGSYSGDGTAVLGVPVLCQGVTWTQKVYGNGSMLALMVAQYRAIDQFGELWVLPLADDGSAVNAVATNTFTGPATAQGIYVVYIGGQRVVQNVTAGMTAAQVATALAATINALPNVPVHATTTGAMISYTAKFAGAAGNEITAASYFMGAPAGEFPVPGLSYSAGYPNTIVQFANGAVNPSLTTPLLALANLPFDFIAMPYTDSTSLTAMDGFLSDSTGRWAWNSEAFGCYFNSYRGTVGGLTTFGTGRNGDHGCTMGFNSSPTPGWLWSAAITAAVAVSVRADPALTLAPIALPGIIAPAIDQRFVDVDRDVLLHDGISTFRVQQDGTVLTERLVTNWQVNSTGAADDSWLDVETNYTLMASIRDIRSFLQTAFARKKLVTDTTRISDTQNTTSAAIIKAAVISRYRYQERLGWVQNSDVFAAGVQAENAGRGQVRLVLPIDCANQLRQIVAIVQFRKS